MVRFAGLQQREKRTTCTSLEQDMMSNIGRRLTAIDDALAAGTGDSAVQLVRAAQELNPSSPAVAVRLLEGCLLDNQLMCAAHGARSLLRFAMADEDESEVCRYLGAAQAFGARAGRLRWCRLGQSCSRLGNTSALDGAAVPYSVSTLATSLDNGELWRGEHLVSELKLVLEDETQWKGREGAVALNHATMQHVQGNADIARDLYARVIRPPDDAPSAVHGTAAAVRAHGYTNLAVLERTAPAARRHLDAALALAPAAPEAAERWLELARVTWQQGQLPSARHALKRALTLAPDAPHAPFAYALHAELHALRHDYSRAAAAAARADGLQAATSPQLPQCARWSHLLPRLPYLWGDARSVRHEKDAADDATSPTPSVDGDAASVGSSSSAPGGFRPPAPAVTSAYRELLLGCGIGHAKRTGGGWHPDALRWSRMRAHDLRSWLELLPAASADEVHWCAVHGEGGGEGGEEEAGADEAAQGHGGGGAAADPPIGVDVWRAVWRVLRPHGLLQVHVQVPPLAVLKLESVANGDDDDDQGGTDGAGSLFAALHLGGDSGAAGSARVAVEAATTDASMWTAPGEHVDGLLFQRVG